MRGGETRFKLGSIPWNLGVPPSEETRRLWSQQRRGKLRGPCDQETKDKISVALTGKKYPNRISSTSFKKGMVPWNKKYNNGRERYLAQRNKLIEGSRVSTIKREFGISAEEYTLRLNSQKMICALCHKPMVVPPKHNGRGAPGNAPVLDHDHETGKLREFIHGTCNRGLGLFLHDVEILKNAVRYLEKHSCQQAS